jgi:AraC-like DNA-binding protein
VVDAVSELLDGHRARGAFLLRCVMSPPWSVRIDDGATVGVLVQVRGELYLTRDGETPVRLAPGDVAVVKGTAPYVAADDPARPPAVVIGPGQECRTVEGGDLSTEYRLGLRTWGNAADGPCAFLTGTYELPAQVTGRLLEAVPEVVVVRAADGGVPAARLLVEEFTRDAPGQDVVLDRLTDLVLVSALRAWFDRAGDAAPPWWRAAQDPAVGAVLRLMHDRPGEPWSLASLAAEVAVSRATLARRFAELLGQPPMAYLAEWRLATAADLLRGTRDTVERIAGRVGYANAFAFSTAFKRRYGVGPRQYRQSAPVAGSLPGAAPDRG